MYLSCTVYMFIYCEFYFTEDHMLDKFILVLNIYSSKNKEIINIMADHIDSIPSYHTPKERQLAAVPELQNHQPYQPS